MKTRFENIKGLLQREEMKKVVGGDVYNGQNTSATGGSAAAPASGTALAGASNTTLGVTISYGTTGNYSTSYNYGAGMTGSSSSGNPANTFSNGGNTSAPTPPKPYGQP